MIYVVELTDEADGDLARLDSSVAQRVVNRLVWLAENAEAVNHQALTGRLRGVYRLRAGDYRILYTLNRQTRRIVVRGIAHRSEAYRLN